MTPGAPKGWTCPDCARTFANANQWHACTDLTVAEHLADHGPLATALYGAVTAALAEHGTFRVHAQRTRIAFVREMTFGSLVFRQRWADLSLVTPTPIVDPRVRRLEVYGPTTFGHTVRLAGVEDVDVDVRGWLGEALRRGDGAPDPPEVLDPLPGELAEVATVPLATRVAVDEQGARSIVLPGWAADLFADRHWVTTRLGGEVRTGRVDVAARRLDLDGDVLASLGLGDGDAVEVHLRPDVT